MPGLGNRPCLEGGALAPRSDSGFTLAEVLLAISTMVLVILTIIALVISLHRGSRKSVDLAAAHLVADQVITELVDQAQKDLPAGAHASFWNNDWTPYREGSVNANRTDFFYRMDATTVRDVSSNPINSNLSFNRVKLIQVELYWWNPAPTPARAGYGKLSTQAVRLVHEKRI